MKATMRTLRPGEVTTTEIMAGAMLEEQPASAQPQQVDRKVTALVAIAKALGGGPLLSGFVGGLIAVIGHSAFDSEKIVHRIERLEAAMISADEHNAWVQAALVALSKNEPVPPPPYRRIAPQ